MRNFFCEVCGNNEEKFIGIKNGEQYCRRCISFCGKRVEAPKKKQRENVEVCLNYELSKEQHKVAKKALANYIQKINTLIYAVCGAGKTELVFEVISYVLKKGGYVGFATPRKDVAIELYPRIKSAFKNCDVTLVCGGHNENLIGDIIVLTTHQLYRYEKYFDLVIVDEIDAFPYKSNELLYGFFKRSVSGNYILLTATPSKTDMETFSKPKHDIIELLVRFHYSPLPIPSVLINIDFINLILVIIILRKFLKNRYPVLVFTPTIGLCEKLYRFLSVFCKNGNYVHSKRHNREEIIDKFKHNTYKYLVTTSVLERGITIKDLQVIIFKFDHDIYDCSTLIQISGRVGRKIGATEGQVVFIGSENTLAARNAVREIRHANKTLQNLLSRGKREYLK